MERSDTAKIVKMLLATLRLPRPIADDEAHLNGWHLALNDLPYDVCERAAATILREEKFMPEPSTVRELALKEIVAFPDADEAWTLLDKRIRHQPQAFARLNEATIDALSDAAAALGGWHTLRCSERPERDREQFYRLWPQIVKRHQRQAPITEYVDRIERGMLLFDDSPVIQRRELPPGYVFVQQAGETLAAKVVQDDEDDPGIGLVPSSIVPREGKS